MFIGMAIAKYWDEDWELYSKVEDLYKYLRDHIDFDHMDDYICEKVLLLDDKGKTELSGIVRMCLSHLQPPMPPTLEARHTINIPCIHRSLAADVPNGSHHRTEGIGLPHDQTVTIPLNIHKPYGMFF